MIRFGWALGSMLLMANLVSAQDLDANKQLVQRFTEALNAADWAGSRRAP